MERHAMTRMIAHVWGITAVVRYFCTRVQLCDTTQVLNLVEPAAISAAVVRHVYSTWVRVLCELKKKVNERKLGYYHDSYLGTILII